jgi:SAM-dependent methyltransferase
VNTLTRLARTVRRRLSDWSQTSDAAFHDDLFSAAPEPRLDFSYVGYATVRRIADLVEPELVKARRVVDIGCGLGEVTCELARRNPEIHFVGLDHSQSGIEKGRRLASRLGLANITFERQRADAEAVGPADVGLFLDSFHHLENPRETVQRLWPHVPRIVLVEPHGDWAGRWDRRLNVDWLPVELDKLRIRLEACLGRTAPASTEASAGDPHGAAVENRYSLSEMTRLLGGYHLRVRGTVSGFDVYPPTPHLDTSSRRLFNRILYDLLAHADAEIEAASLAAAAKHWVIVADRGPETDFIDAIPDAPIPPIEIETAPATQGPLDFEYGGYVGPRFLRAGEAYRVRLVVTNRSWRPIESGPAFALSYHWRRRDGTTLVADGLRTRFPRTLAPGESASIEASIQAPPVRGFPVLAFDVVEEGHAWASDWGVPCLTVAMGVL